MRSEVDELKRFAIADILSVSGKQKTTETINMHINTIIDIAFLKGQQAQQSKVDELQKRLDAAIYLLTSIKAENDLWGCDQVERQIELLEQALKGESNEI